MRRARDVEVSKPESCPQWNHHLVTWTQMKQCQYCVLSAHIETSGFLQAHVGSGFWEVERVAGKARAGMPKLRVRECAELRVMGENKGPLISLFST